MRLLGFLLCLITFSPVMLAAYASTSLTTSPEQTTLRAQFMLAWQAAKHGPEGAWKKLAQGLESYPLYPYLEFADTRRRLSAISHEEIKILLARWPELPVNKDLRESYLLMRAKNQQWQQFSELYQTSGKRELQCYALTMRIRLGEQPDFSKDIEPLWLSTTSLPTACDPVVAWAKSQKMLSPERIWKRIMLIMKTDNIPLLKTLIPVLDSENQKVLNDIIAILNDPAKALQNAKKLTDHPHVHAAVIVGIERLSKKSVDVAEQRWKQLETHFKFDSEQRNQVARTLAWAHATDFSSQALSRLSALPDAANNDVSREWRVRAALTADKPKELLSALNNLSDSQKINSRWRYFRARTLAKQGEKANAETLFSSLAKEADLYGFLAADWLNQPYNICPEKLTVLPETEKKVRQLPGLVRALEWWVLQHPQEARREWEQFLPQLTREERRIAVDIATKNGWYDRAPFTFNQGEELRFYDYRFPLARQSEVEQAARNAGLDPAFPFAIIRAESAWMNDAKSPANAYGLMQLLPSTAAGTAKSAKLSYAAPADLFNPELNIQLGTRYLAEMAEKFQGSPWLASAAYNAGSGAVKRWVSARSSYDPDLFIETIPYKETRDYVARVLAFTVIYDWRLHGDVLPVSSRLPRIGETYTMPGKNIPRKAVVCAKKGL